MAQFLAHLRHLLGSDTESVAHHNSPFLKEMIMREIPTNIKYALLVNNMTTLTEIVEATDKILTEYPESNIPVNNINSLPPIPTPQPQHNTTMHNNTTLTINALTSKMSEMDFKSRALSQEKDHLLKRIDHLERTIHNLEDKMIKEQQSLLTRLQKLEQRPHYNNYGNRGRSTSRRREPSAENRTRCHFHLRFGTNARRCTQPCDMSNIFNNQEGN
jgi:hypothetical protein